MSYELASIYERYLPRFKQRYSRATSQDEWSAINAILGCRTPQYGEIALACDDCPHHRRTYCSCGHRACNQCQHHTTRQWLARQQSKLLPVDYYMVTFTLPKELRGLAKAHQKTVYSLLFQCAVSTLKTFGLNKPNFAAELAMTGVLHTHTRRLDYHPHVHMIVPASGIHNARKEWRKIKGKYLFNGFALATAFRGAMLSAIEQAGLYVPLTPKKWVVQCQRVGRGLPALKYLSRYLYRGVISNHNIIDDDGDYVTFRYTQSGSQHIKTRRVKGEDFMALVLQHTLPKGLRRARDYGFLHGNAKRRLKVVQWVLKVINKPLEKIDRPTFTCTQCGAPMSMIGFIRPKQKPG
jgi:hypothetical protein